MIEERPVVTRMFTFTTCEWGLLRMRLLNLPVTILTTSTTKPQEENATRLRNLKEFYEDEKTDPLLREVGVCLRLTNLAMSITAQKATQANKKLPLLVRLGKAEIQIRTSMLFDEILRRLRDDPRMGSKSGTSRMVLTMMHVVIRGDEFVCFPTQGFTLSREYNVSYAGDIVKFLYMDDGDLDVGYF